MENEMPEGLAKSRKARTIDERCQLLRDAFCGKCYASLEECDGEHTFLRAWEWKRTGEAGSTMLTAEETRQERIRNLSSKRPESDAVQ